MNKGKKIEKNKLKSLVDFYLSIDKRKREIIYGISFLLISIFLTGSLFSFSGDLGRAVKEALFYNGDEITFLGASFILIILFLIALSIYNLFNYKPISRIRLWGGFLILFFSINLFITITFGEVMGGSLGNFLFGKFIKLFGDIVYLIIPILFLISLYTLKILSPKKIYNWLLYKESGDVLDKSDIIDENVDVKKESKEVRVKRAPKIQEYKTNEVAIKKLKVKKKKTGNYKLPKIDLLNKTKEKANAGDTKEGVNIIERTLKNFNIDVVVESVVVGPTVTRYSARPSEGVRLSRITSLSENIELALAAHPIRIEAPIPGQSLVGIEVPNKDRATIGLYDLLSSSQFQKDDEDLPVLIGKTINGDSFVKKLAKMPHLLVGGTTGSGKSVLIHSIIVSLLYKYTADELKFIFIDPKRVELTLYKGIPHLLTEPITDPKKAVQSLAFVVGEMEKRYEMLEEVKCRDIKTYNKKVKEDKMPYLVVVIDELADLMQQYGREVEGHIVRIAQKSRAVGIHLILSTQRPSVNVITGVVKANIPVRIALQVASAIDSRTILDTTGAENLTGNGDLLFTSSDTKKPIRAQGGFISDEEVKDVVNFIIEKNGVALDLIDISKEVKIGGGKKEQNEDDDLYEEAKEIVISTKKGSTSLLQRKLKIGYSRAARLIDMLEENGVLSQQVGSRPRDVLVD